MGFLLVISSVVLITYQAESQKTGRVTAEAFRRPPASTYRSDDPGGAQLRVAASPHPPVVVLALLQEVLVTPVALLLIAYPAKTTEARGQ